MSSFETRVLLVAISTLAASGRAWAVQSGDLVASPEVQAAIQLMERQFEADRQQLHIPGLSAALVLDQKIIWARGFGYADVERRVPATPQTLYCIGSITKLFTATMLMQLRDRGRLRLDDSVARFLPELPGGARARALSRITFRQLVTHTSGLPTEAPLPYWETLGFPDAEHLLGSLDTVEVGPPGIERKYSNVGFAVLGEALSRVAGQPYAAYVTERILAPLDMRSSTFSPAAAPRSPVATGYTRYRAGRRRLPAPTIDLATLSAAGGLYASVQDMARFISLQFRDDSQPAGGAQVLRGTSVREMHAVQGMNPDWQGGWALGFGLGRVGERVVAGHSGGIHGFSTQVLLIPGEKLGIAVFANSNTELGAFGGNALELLVAVLDGVRGRSAPSDTTALPAAWARYVGVYEHAVGSDIEVRLVGDHLVLASPDSPAEPGDPLTPEGAPNRFRVKDESAAGQAVSFELGPTGPARRIRVGPYVFDRKP